MSLRVEQYLVLNDNYNYLLIDEATNKCGVVDPSMMLPTLKVLQDLGLELNYIFHTHHHYDHVDGNPPLCDYFPEVKVVGPKDRDKRIPNISIELNDGESFSLGQTEIKFISTPGHTSSHCAYYIESLPGLFCGDLLFTLGCGKIFEGDFGIMYDSLKKIASLPPDTKIFCAHEYTLENGAFAMTVEPENKDLVERIEKAKALRADFVPTVPSKISDELLTNPFLRCSSEEIQKNLNMDGKTELEVFSKLRMMKDNFKG